MSLPTFNTTDRILALMQSAWASEINPLLTNPFLKGRLIPGVELAIGDNVINHKLGRKLQGWVIVGIDGVADIYDAQASNSMPELTLVLNSSAVVGVSLYVF